MTPRRTPRATPRELAIMRILWEQGPRTVREVWDALEHGDQVGYTTVLKQLQMLEEKGFVSCNNRQKTNVYKAKMSEEDTQRGATKELVTRLYRGSHLKIVTHLLSEKPPSKKELLEIRQKIDELLS